MQARQIGLTKIYNAVHDESVEESDIVELRVLHEQIDLTLAESYGWSSLNLEHKFHRMRQGVRHAFSPAVQIEVLDRLLELNQESYASNQVIRGQAHTGRTTKGVTKEAELDSDSSGLLF